MRQCKSCNLVKRHKARGLCSACYRHHATVVRNLDQFPPLRAHVSPRARYEAWVASGLTPRQYARDIGILETSLCRALRQERERRERLGLAWLTGWRKLRGV